MHVILFLVLGYLAIVVGVVLIVIVFHFLASTAGIILLGGLAIFALAVRVGRLLRNDRERTTVRR